MLTPRGTGCLEGRRSTQALETGWGFGADSFFQSPVSQEHGLEGGMSSTWSFPLAFKLLGL